MKRIGESSEITKEALEKEMREIELERVKKENEEREKMKEYLSYIEKEEKEKKRVYINKDEEDIDRLEEVEYPRIVKEVFKKKNQGIISKIKEIFGFGDKEMKEKIKLEKTLKYPLLFLLKNDGYIDVIEGLKVNSLFTMKEKKGNEKKGIILTSKKLHTLNLEPYPKCWIASEDEMLPYPSDIMYDAGEFVKIVRKIETTKGLLKDESKLLNAKMWYTIAVLGMILLIAYFGFQNGWFDKILGRLLLPIITGGI